MAQRTTQTAQAPDPESGRRWPLRRVVYIVFSLAVTGGILGYLFTHVSPGEVLRLIRGANRKALLVFLLFSAAMSVFRTWRYKLVLRVAGQSPGSVALFLTVLVRNFFSDLLPARLGTLIYVYIVTSRLGVPFGAATSSFLLAFVFDMVALAPLILAAGLAAGAATRIPLGMLYAGGLVLAVGTVAVLFALPHLFGWVTRFFDKLVREPGKRLRLLRDKWVEAGREIQRARRAGIYLKLFVLSLLVRIGKYGALYVLLFALIGPLGYGLRELSVGKVFIGLCSAELAASLPVSGIAGFGVYEGTWAVVFELLGFPGHIAKLTSLSHHLLTQLYGYLLGALALLVLMLPVFNKEKGRKRRALRAAPPMLLLCLCCACACGCSDNATSASPSAAMTEARALPAELKGTLVFQRPVGIYSWRLGDSAPTLLARDGNYPRWAPDGRAIAFLRGNDLMVIGADGQGVRRLAAAETAKAVAWHPDGDRVLFTDGTTIKSVSIETLAVETVAAGFRFLGVDIAPDGRRLVSTVKKLGYHVYAFDLQTGRHWKLGPGCSASLAPDGRLVTNNIGAHHELILRAWQTGALVRTLRAPEGTAHDNHFWSNHPDWIACIKEGDRTDIMLCQISANRCIQVTSTGDCDRPDLYVED